MNIYDAARLTDLKAARDACIERLVDDLSDVGAQVLVLERDDSVTAKDRALIAARVQKAGCPDLRYMHLRAHEDALLAVPDAVAWCWKKGGQWQREVSGLVRDVRVL